MKIDLVGQSDVASRWGSMSSRATVQWHLLHLLHSKEARLHHEPKTQPTFKELFIQTSYRNPTLFSVSQAGLVNNLNDGMAWGLFPVFFAAHGLGVESIAVLVATYPAVWSVLQIATGALSDRSGRKSMIVIGMWLQGAAILLVAATPTLASSQLGNFSLWIIGSVLLGVGTALVYPT